MCKLIRTGLGVTLLTLLVGYFVQSNIEVHIQSSSVRKSTWERLAEHGYRSERHSLQTADGYILQMIRITQGPTYRKRAMIAHRPVVLFGHGLLGSADTWIITGPDASLAYIMADLGYDVWLGNFRGNRYASRHSHLSPQMDQFWQYSLDELGRYDLTAMIDYALNATGHSDLHYLCYSFGCTTLFVALSSQPDYNRKLRTSHHLGPLMFLNFSQVPLRVFDAFGFPHDSAIGSFFSGREMFSHGYAWNWLCQKMCEENSPTYRVCGELFGLAVGGWNISSNLLTDFCATHPSGSSTNLILHFMQLRKAGRFQPFDYGSLMNHRVYKQLSPPAYDVSLVSSPIHIYCSDGDPLSQPADNEALAQMLPNASVHLVPAANFYHFDFLWDPHARELLYETIVRKIQQYEEHALNQ